MIYLASPYSHPDESVRLLRYSQTEAFTARMLRSGIIVFSPIIYGHYIAEAQSLPSDAEFWKPFNRRMIQKSTELWVLTLDGWQNSIGVSMEIQWAERLNLPITYKDYPNADF